MTTAPPSSSKWPIRRLGDVLIRHNEIIHPGDRKGEATFVGLEHIEPNTGKRIGSLTIDLDKLTGRKPTFRRGQIVYGYLRPYLNKVWIADFDGCSSVDQFAFEVRQDMADRDFVAAFMRSETFLRRSRTGTTLGQLPRINVDEIAAVPIELPPIAEQRRIAVELSQTSAVIDTARRAAEERLGAAEALPAAYLREVFEGPPARNWPRLPIGSLGDPTRGDTVQTGPFGAQLPSSEFKTEGVPVLNIGNVKNGALNLKRLDHVTAQKAQDLERYRLREGDMLFTRSGSVGRSAVVDAQCEGWLMSYHLLRVAFDRGRVEPGFISAAIRGDLAVLKQVQLAAGRGATRGGINAPILAALSVPVPGLDIQRNVLTKLSRRLVEVDGMIARCRDELAAINALPGSLLRAAFDGGS